MTTEKPDPEKDDHQLVYGVVNGGLVFIPKERAIELSWIWEAQREAKTWGEFRKSIPLEDWNGFYSSLKENSEYAFEGFFDELRDRNPKITKKAARLKFNELKLSEGRLPRDEDAFEAETLYLEEGDWPEWPAQWMLDWVPQAIQREFGKIDVSRISGEMLTLPPEDFDRIVAAFEAEGYTCRRDDQLVKRASGYAEPPINI